MRIIIALPFLFTLVLPQPERRGIPDADTSRPAPSSVHGCNCVTKQHFPRAVKRRIASFLRPCAPGSRKQNHAALCAASESRSQGRLTSAATRFSSEGLALATCGPIWRAATPPLTLGGLAPEPDLAVVLGRREDHREAHPHHGKVNSTPGEIEKRAMLLALGRKQGYTHRY